MPQLENEELKSIDELTDEERKEVDSVKYEVNTLLVSRAAELRAISKQLGLEEPEGLTALIEKFSGRLKEGLDEYIVSLEEGYANLAQPYDEDELISWAEEISEEMASDLGTVNDWAKSNHYDSTITDEITDGPNLIIRQARNMARMVDLRNVKSEVCKELTVMASEVMQLYRSASVMSPPVLRSLIYELEPYRAETEGLNDYILCLQGASIPPGEQGQVLRNLNTEVADIRDVLEEWARTADCTAEAQEMLRHVSMLTSAIENAYKTFPGDVVKASKTRWERFKEGIREYFSGPSTSPESLGIAWDSNDKE